MMSNTESVPSRSSLPERYAEGWRDPFLEKVFAELRPDMKILDVGSGRLPAIPREQRPENCFYVGIDISEKELRTAPPGSYDEMIVGDIVEPQEELREQFDLALSWQVFEHVKPLESALDNVYTYLKPNGRFLTQFSGTFSAFGLINQVIPSSFGPWVLKTLLGRDPEKVFPAHYHHCWDNKVQHAMAGWSWSEVTPRYMGAGYWKFARPLQRGYLLYENWAASGKHLNLATHYLVDARR